MDERTPPLSDPIDRAIRVLERIFQHDSEDAIRHLRSVVAELRHHPQFNPKRVLHEIEALQDRSVITIQDVDGLALRIVQETQ